MNKPALKAKKHWYDYLWIASLLYLFLGFFNIMFAWLGLICFLVPLAISIATGSKLYCNRYCGRGQLFSILGKKLHLSPNREIPGWMKSKAFRYGFLVFFLVMFCQMLFNTYLVFRGTSGLKQAVTVLWTFRLPWQHAYHGTGLPLWTAQFAFGFYSVMLTSTILGLATMVLFRPRSWCVYCPMGTMTQMICKAKAGACPGAGPPAAVLWAAVLPAAVLRAAVLPAAVLPAAVLPIAAPPAQTNLFHDFADSPFPYRGPFIPLIL